MPENGRSVISRIPVSGIFNTYSLHFILESLNIENSNKYIIEIVLQASRSLLLREILTSVLIARDTTNFGKTEINRFFV